MSEKLSIFIKKLIFIFVLYLFYIFFAIALGLTALSVIFYIIFVMIIIFLRLFILYNKSNDRFFFKNNVYHKCCYLFSYLIVINFILSVFLKNIENKYYSVFLVISVIFLLLLIKIIWYFNSIKTLINSKVFDTAIHNYTSTINAITFLLLCIIAFMIFSMYIPMSLLDYKPKLGLYSVGIYIILLILACLFFAKAFIKNKLTVSKLSKYTYTVSTIGLSLSSTIIALYLFTEKLSNINIHNSLLGILYKFVQNNSETFMILAVAFPIFSFFINIFLFIIKNVEKSMY